MKEKRMKGSTRKVLLMGVAAVLVAAISVGATLAYLTAQTGSVTNKFTGSGGIRGNVLEPHYETDQTYTYTTGKPQSKDPLVVNMTEDAAIWTGARVSFFIDVDDGYVQVTEDVFRQYVDIKYNGTDGYNTGNALTNDEAVGVYPTGTDVWVKMNPTSENTTDAGKSIYFMYDRVLTKADSDPAYTDIIDGSADHTDVIDVSKYKKGDSTLPIFTTVTVKNDVRIESGLTSGYTTSIDPISTANGTGPSGKIFKKFNYKIIVNGYGEKAYAVDTNGNGTGDVLCKRSEAKAEILAKLEALTNAKPTTANP